MLRQFGGLCIGMLIGMGGWQWFTSGEWERALVYAGIAVTIAGITAFVPAMLRPVFVGWMVLVFPIGWLVSRAVLVLLFLGIITPIALVFRLSGRDLLTLRRRPDVLTYWKSKAAAPDLASYFRQS